MSEAAVPATTGSSTDVVAQPDQSDLMTGVNRLGLFRQIGLMIGLAGSVALGLALVLWLQEPNYQPAMQNIAAQDMEEVTRILNVNGIDFKVDPKSGVLLVASEQLYQAKIKLAAMGISSDQSIGYELLDQDQGLGSSQFMESTRFKRGLEGELARTISSFRNIRSARVHLAIPKRSVFVRDARQPSASVLIEVPTMRGVSRDQVEAIVNLVAGSVPEMISAGVTVVDQRGNLLSKNNESEMDARVSREFEYSRKIESVLNNRINSILEPVIGAGRYRSEVSADIDFTEIEEAEELFNPDMTAVRSEQTLDEQNTVGADGGIPGALANQPPADANAPEVAGGAAAGQGQDANPTSLRKQSTRNYEVDRTVSYTRHQKGRIARLTVAVAIDDIRTINPDNGEVSFQKWSDAELERLNILVRNAVGFSASRGDSVNVINTPFAAKEIETFVEPEIWEQSWFWEVIWKALAVIVALIVVFAVIRPTFKNLVSSGVEAKEVAFAGGGDPAMDSFERMDSGGGAGMGALGVSGEDFMLPGASEGYDKQINALKGLVAEDPARVAQVVRTWVNQDGK